MCIAEIVHLRTYDIKCLWVKLKPSNLFNIGRRAADREEANEKANENINMVAEDSLGEKNSSNDDNDLEAGTKFDAIQGDLLGRRY